MCFDYAQSGNLADKGCRQIQSNEICDHCIHQDQMCICHSFMLGIGKSGHSNMKNVNIFFSFLEFSLLCIHSSPLYNT